MPQLCLQHAVDAEVFCSAVDLRISPPGVTPAFSACSKTLAARQTWHLAVHHGTHDGPAETCKQTVHGEVCFRLDSKVFWYDIHDSCHDCQGNSMYKYI